MIIGAWVVREPKQVWPSWLPLARNNNAISRVMPVSERQSGGLTTEQTSAGTRTMENDLEFFDHSSLFLAYGRSLEGEAWLEQNLAAPDGVRSFGGGVAIEPRYVEPIVLGAIEDGLRVEVLTPWRAWR
jgi:hypothetical protein